MFPVEQRYGKPMRVWTDPDGNGFKVEMFDSPERDNYGKWLVPYRLSHNGETIFEETLHASPMHSTDGAETLAAIICFCSLRPGDTDPEYFADYSERQLAWCREWGETLSLYEHPLENHPEGMYRCATCLNLFDGLEECHKHADATNGEHDVFTDSEGLEFTTV